MNKQSILLRKTFFLSAIFFLTLLFSCKKDGELSPDFDNGNLAISFVDTFSIKTSVIQDDSIRTDLASLQLLGVYNDPVFGPTSSSIYTNVSPVGFPLNFGTTITIDSVVLSLSYAGLFGDTSSSLTVNVFELSSPLDPNTDYYSSDSSLTKTALLGSTTLQPSIIDSVLTEVDSVIHAPHIRINLNDPTFLAALITGSPFNDLSAFNDVLNGVHIVTSETATANTPNTDGGSISAFDLNASASRVTVYYNNDVSDSLQESFSINSNVKKYGQFIHSYSSEIEDKLTNSANQDTSRIYVATMARVRSKIEFPTIKDLAQNGNVIINKAELILTIDDLTLGSFTTPIEDLALTGIDQNGDAIFIPDNFEGQDHFGGSYDSGTKSYTFNISRHLHDLVYNTTTDYGMYLISTNAAVTANRSILGSEKSPNYKIRLEITYSKL